MNYCFKLNKLLFFVAALVFLSVSHPSSAVVLDRIVAKVNDDIITLSYLQDKVMYLQQTGQHIGAGINSERDLMEKAMGLIIDEKLQIQEATRLGVSVSEETIDKAIDDILAKNNWNKETLESMLTREGTSLKKYRKRISEQILTSKIVSYSLRNRIKVSEKAMKEYYVDHEQEFKVPEQYQLSHILLIFDSDISDSMKGIKRSKAREILTKLKGGADFAEMAQLYSEDVSASNGGDLGLMERGKMVKVLEDAASNLKPGMVSDIIESQHGLHIIKLVKLIPGDVKPYIDVRKDIENILFQEKRASGYLDWMEELKESAFLQVNLFQDDEEKKKWDRFKSADQIDVADIDEPVQPLFQIPNDPEPERATPSRAKTQKRGDSPKVAQNSDPEDFSSVKKRLRYYKSLRDKNIISEAEYAERKKELLNKL